MYFIEKRKWHLLSIGIGLSFVEEGYLRRVRNGVYSFNEWKGKKSISLSQTAEKIRDLLDEIERILM